MLRKEMTKVEIEKELAGQGDYVQIDNITRFLKESIPTDVKRFVYSKLVAIYEKRAMFGDAALIYEKLVEIALSKPEKVNYFTKAAECYIKAGFFDKADLSVKKAVNEGTMAEKAKITNSIRDFYKNQAETYEKERRRNNAVKTYEKMLAMNYPDTEKKEINIKLAGLYKNLGMIEKYITMQKKL
jgi:tetratricopeptide (TPR) repeat protein